MRSAVLLLVVVASCGGPAAVDAPAAPAPSAPRHPAPAATTAALVPGPSHVVVEVEETGGFLGGRRATTIYDDGSFAVLASSKDLPRRGQLGRATLDALIAEIERARFFELPGTAPDGTKLCAAAPNRPPRCVTERQPSCNDCVTIATTFRHDGRELTLWRVGSSDDAETRTLVEIERAIHRAAE